MVCWTPNTANVTNTNNKNIIVDNINTYTENLLCRAGHTNCWWPTLISMSSISKIWIFIHAWYLCWCNFILSSLIQLKMCPFIHVISSIVCSFNFHILLSRNLLLQIPHYLQLLMYWFYRKAEAWPIFWSGFCLEFLGADKGQSPQFSSFVEFSSIDHPCTTCDHIMNKLFDQGAVFCSIQILKISKEPLCWLDCVSKAQLHPLANSRKSKGPIWLDLCQNPTAASLFHSWALLKISLWWRQPCFCFVSEIIVRINNFVSKERQMILCIHSAQGRHSLINGFQVLSLFIVQFN